VRRLPDHAHEARFRDRLQVAGGLGGRRGDARRLLDERHLAQDAPRPDRFHELSVHPQLDPSVEHHVDRVAGIALAEDDFSGLDPKQLRFVPRKSFVPRHGASPRHISGYGFFTIEPEVCFST
jgi:hypothetical protein